MSNEKPKTGTLDDLIAAAVPLVVADEAADFLACSVIDVQTGTELRPGDPEACAGNGKEDPMACCCDGCDYYLACFPEAMPKEDEDMEEERYNTLIRYKCKRCGFELERRYANPNAYGGGMVTCTCGSFDLDPHPLWPCISWRNGVDPREDLEEYFETAPVEEKQEDVKKSLAAVFDHLHSDDD